VVGTLVALLLGAAPGSVATADPVSDTQAQIAALETQVASGAGHIHALTEAYQQANLQAAILNQQLTTDDATLQTMRTKMTASLSTLRDQAIRSYTGTQAEANSYAALGGSADPAVRTEYLTVVSGDVTDSVDQMKVQQSQLQAQAATVKNEQRASTQAVRAAADARSSALALADHEQSQLDHLQAILQSQVAARQQAEAAAAAAAAAQAAANRTASTAAPAKVAKPPATQGAPVNGGLVASVQQVVSPPAASAAPAPAAPAPAAPPAPAPGSAASGGGGGAGGNWARLRECESGDNYQENTGNGFYGAYQFSASTWTGLGYPGRPDQEPPSMQDAAAAQLQARSGWGQWPACSAALGLT
jgi:hypothetical protein